MTRLNLMLLLAVIGSALYLVSVQYESRRLFAEINKAESEARRIRAEREQLQLEKRAQATPLRVERLARDQLQMRVATPAITHYVRYSAPDSAAPAAPAATPALQVQGQVQ